MIMLEGYPLNLFNFIAFESFILQNYDVVFCIDDGTFVIAMNLLHRMGIQLQWDGFMLEVPYFGFVP